MINLVATGEGSCRKCQLQCHLQGYASPSTISWSDIRGSILSYNQSMSAQRECAQVLAKSILLKHCIPTCPANESHLHCMSMLPYTQRSRAADNSPATDKYPARVMDNKGSWIGSKISKLLTTRTNYLVTIFELLFLLSQSKSTEQLLC